MKKDEFERYEHETRGLINALRCMAQDKEVPPDFLARLTDEIEALPAPRPGFFDWPAIAWNWVISKRLRFAMTLVFVLCLFGAVPQYVSWFKSYVGSAPTRIDISRDDFMTSTFAGGESSPGKPILPRGPVISRYPLCERWKDNSRTVRKRRVESPDNRCFDQEVDVRTSRIVNSRPAPCVPSC